MSTNSSQIDANEEAELTALLGGPVESAPEVQEDDLGVAMLTARVRGEILAAVKEEGVGVRELARRLHVSPAAVSRHLRSEGDLRLSTASLFASALGREWSFQLKRCEAAQLSNGSLLNVNAHAHTTVRNVEVRSTIKEIDKTSGSATASGRMGVVFLSPRPSRSGR
jgi:DNA-binding transcriptional ArsR family regulator